MKSRIGLTSALTGLLLIGGCAVDQKKEVSLYRSVLDATSPPPPAYDAKAKLSLIDALSLANANNEQIASSGEDYVQALIAKQRAVAGFLPTVSFQPAYTVEQRPRTGTLSTATVPGGQGGASSTGSGNSGATGTGSGAVGSTSSTLAASGLRQLSPDVAYSLQAPVVGSINLFRGGYDVAINKAADAIALQRKLQLLDLQSTVLVDVAQTYYAVLRAERSVQLLRNTLQLQEARLRDVTQQFQNGLAIRLAVAQTRAQVDSTRVSLVQAEGDVKNGRSTLAFLIGVPEVNGPLLDDFPMPARVADEVKFENEALRARQDLAAAHAGVEAARHDVDAALAEYYPSISLNVQGFLWREYYSDASKWNALLTANVPIFSAGIIEADVRNAWSHLRQAALQESYIHRQVLNQIQTNYQNLTTADRRVYELNDEVAAANDAFQQAKNAFANNLAINLDVLTAQDQLLASQLDLANARFDRTVFYLDLLRTTGTLSVNQVIGIVAATQPVTTQPTDADSASTQPASIQPASTQPE
ncbi:MAG: TolC family protein [Tepidisphaeraceae bacterium]